MKKIILFIILMCLITSILIILIPIDNDDNLIKYNKIKQKLKSGDIILFSCKKFNSPYNKLEYFLRTKLLGHEFGHAGIIWALNGKHYVIESTSYNHEGFKKAVHLNSKKQGGVRIIELDTLLKEYYKQNNAVFGIKYISKEIPKNIVIKNIKKYNNVEFPSKFLFFIVAAIDIFISNDLAVKASQNLQSDNKKMCTEFVHEFLNKCKVLKDYPSKLFWPFLLRDDHFKRFENVKYSNTYKFSIQ